MQYWETFSSFFMFCYYFCLPKGIWNKFPNTRNSENISRIALGSRRSQLHNSSLDHTNFPEGWNRKKNNMGITKELLKLFMVIIVTPYLAKNEPMIHHHNSKTLQNDWSPPLIDDMFQVRKNTFNLGIFKKLQRRTR